VTVVDGNGLFLVDPNINPVTTFEDSYVEDTTVTLRAAPDANYYVEGWYDANTLVSVLGVHDVVMDSNHTYTLRFRQPIKINVGQGPGHDHATIQAALADGSSGDDTIARSGDTIIVHEGTYQGDLNFGGREDVRLISTAPEDPDVAAKTIIDCQGSGRAFTFNHGEDTNTVVDGFTIINGGLNGEPGGAIYIDANSNPTLAHLIISNFSVSDADGGAIYIGPGSSPKLCAITINSCSVSSGDGGAIYADSNSSPTFKKLEISNCSASDGDGGAVYVGPDSTPTFIQCTITGCSASDGYGGAVYCGAGSSPELTDCEFSGNTAGHGGGGLYCSDDSTSTLDRCTLTNNEAGSGGGAYYALGCVSEVNECTFVGNRALLDAGGGIRYKGDSSITIVDCNISDNSAQHAGALCFDSNCSGAVTNSLMLGNDANMYGGAVYVTDCDLLVADCNISYNTALYGAGLYCVDSPLVTIANCDIKHNEAVGIKIYYEYYLPDPNDPNWPLDPNDPNAQVLPPIQVFPDDPNFNPNDPNLITLTIEDRTAIARGGGIYSWSGPSLIQDCEIIGNSAGTSGGGIYFAYGEYYLTTLKNCLLAYNSAIRDGGGVSSNWGNWLLISNCTIADNTVPGIGGGLYASYESNVEVVNSIIWRNIGAAGAQIAAGSGADCQSYAAAVDVTYSTVGPYFEPVDPNDPNQVGLISPIGFAPVLTVTTPVDAETLVENILGTGISASNISFTGDPNAAGTFVGGIAAGIGMEAGIILTSGHASTAPGADPCQPGVNSQDGATGNNGQPGDDDLAELIPGYSVHDAVVLEFDFVSEGGDLFFSYVFASEEYNEYANTSFNDVFGFFLDGKNIALIPGTQTPVSINNVNGGNPFGQDASYPELFNNNDPSDLEGDEPGYAFEYDGFLNVFTAEALNVGPGVHHIKLAIADAGDSILDSAVFFQYGSFSDVRPFYPPIFVEGDATLVGWQPDEPNNPWSWTPESWDANNFNLGEDPNFVHGYYLSHIDTDQEVNSPCIDAGTGLAKDVFTGAGTYTTRIDGANDIPDSNVDMGYHYGEGVALYELTITLTDANGTFTVDPDYFKSYDSNTNTYTYTNFVGHVSTLTALPDANYYVEAWYEPNGAAASISKVFDVVMDSNRAYTLEFKPRRTTLVTGGGPALRDAVEAAGHGDIIVVEKGYTYDGDIDLQGKEIAIVSILPVNPDLVETAIIDCGGSTRAFIFDSGEGPGTVIEGFTIINGSLSGTSGGAIYIGFGSSPTLADLIIRNCSVVNGSGGAIYVGSNSGASLNNIVIENCSASGNGGGVYISSNSNPTLKYCKIINCSASMGSGGGVYCGTASSPEFTGCTFSDNYARYSGGGLHCAHEGAVTLNECTFSRNTADSGGGAYCGINCVSDVNGCTFSGNSATEDYGGGILYGVGNVMTVNDCNFANNSAIFGGGLYCEPNCTGTITNSLLVGNDADEDGGAIYITDSNIVVSECDILSNTAPHGAGLYCLYSPESSIVGCNIRHNEALRVVVSYEYFYPDPNDANLPDLDNPVDTSDPNFDPNDPNYTSVQHRDDTGPAQGGGIFSFAGPQLIKDCQISYNTATTSGGAVYLAGDDDFESGVAVELKNCLITKNQAGRDGAGISCNWFIEAIISNCTIANNRLIGLLSYGGGLYCSFESDVLVTDSIIWGNSSVKGSQLAVGSGARSYEWPSTLTVEHSVVDTRIAEPSQPVNPDALPVIREGFDAYSLAANDDLYTDLVDIGFIINYYGTITSSLYVNNNGNVTFDAPMGTYTPFGLTGEIGTSIIAPFFADVDTRPEGSPLVTYGTGLVDGHLAFGVNWLNVGYYSYHMDKLCSFQLILIDRSDRAPGDFDIEFNYEKIEWETGDASMGVNGFGGESARAGFSNGTGRPGTFMELEGSGVHGAFLDSSETGLIYLSRDSSIPGRLIFAVESGLIRISAGDPIHVEDGCTLIGWDPNEPNCPWELGTTNICGDPCFVGGYYLSHIAAGQLFDSPAIDAGSADANDPSILLHTYTTRIDGVPDDYDPCDPNDDPNSAIVDIGYHYSEGATQHELIVTVVDANGEPVDPNSARGYVDPNSGWYYEGTELTLRAIPEPNYYVRAWYDANGTAISIKRTLDVVMDSNQTFGIEFKPANYTEVSGGGDALQQAVEDAENGDVLIVSEGIYDGNIVLEGKEIRLFSFNHDDPNIVPWTVIDCRGSGRAFIFNGGEDANTVISGFRIVNGSLAGEGGAAIFVGAGASPYIANMIISDCGTSDGRGGAIYIGAGASPTFVNVTINNCSVYSSDGGAVYVSFYASPEFRDCTFTDCTVSRGSGGAVYCGMSSSTVFTNCTFADNYVSSERGTPVDPNFIVTYAGGDGGAICCALDAEIELTDCTFSGNAADFLGGGVLCNVGNVITVAGCDFTNNSANYGGALYLGSGCEGTITDTTLTSNEADEDGGGIYFTECDDFLVVDCSILRNRAARGAGLYGSYSPMAEVINCTIQYNEARRIIRSYYPPDPNDPNLPDLDNPVDTTDPNFNPGDPNYIVVEDGTGIARGGGIFSFAGPGLIADCQITDNTATTCGGGLYLSSDDDVELAVRSELKNCLITDNTAGRDGAGVSCNWFVDVLISNCTIADNKLTIVPSFGGGLYCSYKSIVEVIDSIIWGNVGSHGSQVAVGSGNPAVPLLSVVSITHSDIQVYQDPCEANDVGPIGPIGGGDPDNPDYFIYSRFDTGLDYRTDEGDNYGPLGVGSYVGSDGIDRVIYYGWSYDDPNGTTYSLNAHIYRVTIPAGADPHAHPNNPYSPGPIAPRTFTAERSFPLGSEFTFSDHSAFCVDVENNVLYLGPDPSILKYVFDPNAANPVAGGPAGNYVFDSVVGPQPGELTQTMTWDPNNNVFYAGTHDPVQILKYDAAQGPAGIWELAFEYTPVTAGSHHDGLAFANGNLFIVDMVCDWVLEYTPDGEFVGIYYHEPIGGGGEIESMGYGALGHFWAGSFSPIITEFGGGEMQQGVLEIPVGPPIRVEEGCILYGWEPNDPYDFWTWDVNSWTDDTNNIDEDPAFVGGYYLSHYDTGQDANSPCVDRGSGDANDPNIAMDMYTTSMDGANDTDLVDMGYHYSEGLIRYDLTIIVVDSNGGTVEANAPRWVTFDPNTNTYSYYAGTVVTLIADPCEAYRVMQWTGTENTPAWNTNENTVTVTSDTTVTVAFEPIPIRQLHLSVVGGPGMVEPNYPAPLFADANAGIYDYYDLTEVQLIATPLDPNYEVKFWTGTDDDLTREPNKIVTMNEPNEYVTVEFGLKGLNDIYIEREPNTFYVTIQSAIDAAIYEGDVVIVCDGTYTGPGNRDLQFRGVPVTVRSKDGSDNCIIYCGGGGYGGGPGTEPHRGFIFDGGEDPNYIVDGFTITDGYADFGGALFYDGNSSPWVENCLITGNHATDGGGGVYLRNTSGGADADDPNAVAPMITNCKIINNYSYGDGGGIYLTNAFVRITNCQISNNWAGGFGGGVYAEAGSAPEIINCLITQNTSTEIGGAIYLYESPATIRFCTIVYNYGLEYPTEEFPGPGPKGGIAARDSSPVINHCIIGLNGGLWGYWGSPWYYGDDLYNCSATYSCIENGDEGEGNISLNPLFTAGGLGPFYLSQMTAGQAQTSPCVDAGGEYALNDLLDDPNYNLGEITTNIKNYPDSGPADMGYHYPFYDGPPVMYTLTISIDGSNGIVQFEYHDPNYVTIIGEVNSVTSPVDVNLIPGTMVTLLAQPDANCRVLYWLGTDDDTSFANYNTATMYSHRVVNVAFEPVWPRTLHVGGTHAYTSIQTAINDARDGDTIVIATGEYPGTGYTVVGKNITIVGNPDDPNSVVINCADENRGGFHLIGTPGGTCVLNGVTIANINTYVMDAIDPEEPGQRGFDGGDNMSYVNMDTYGGAFTGTGYVGSSAAITVVGNHVVANCIVRNCSVTGGNASGGNAGGEERQPGGAGGNGGSAGGAGIYIGEIFYYEYVADPYSPFGYKMFRWGCTPTIINCLIENCNAFGADGGDGGGGAQYARGGSGGMAGQALGAGIFCDAGTKPTFINCTVRNCQGTGGNGGDGGDGGEYGAGGYGGLTDHDPNQDDPAKFSARGGAVYCAVLSEPNFVGCNFVDNVTEGSISGLGGFSWSGVQEQPRRNYNIPSFGAAVHCGSGCKATFEGCRVEGNRATYHGSQPTGYGGGICLEGSRTSLDPNDIYMYGRYMDAYDYGYYEFGPVEATLADCNFVDNSASIGGAIYWTTAEVGMMDCSFFDNTAYVGGGLFSIDSVADISRCVVQGNIVSGEASLVGPNEPNDANVPVVIYGAGGGFYVFTTDANIFDCVFMENRATGSGGGLYLGGHPASTTNLGYLATPELTNCLIANNISGKNGGGISCDRLVEAAISNCTIADNELTEVPSYGGGLYCTYGSTVDVINSIIWGNIGAYGSQVAIEDEPFYPIPSTVSITNSDIQIYQDPCEANDVGPIGPIGGGDPNNPDYFIYAVFDTNLSGTFGPDGWVGSDGTDRIIYVSGSTAYIHTVTIPEGTSADTHPNNPYDTGPMEPRTFTLERTFALGDYSFGHSAEFYVDAENNEIYVKSSSTGILKFVFDPAAANPVAGGPAGNYVFDSTIAPSFEAGSMGPQTLAYDEENDIWYSCTDRFEMYRYDGSWGPDGTWEWIFTYPEKTGASHHDGMEFFDGYLWIGDQLGDWILQYTPDGVLVNEFYHEALPYDLEGMGFGALNHFWIGSFAGFITEFGGGVLQQVLGGEIPVGPPIYVDETCWLYGWEPNDANDFYSWDVNSWNPDTNNIDLDPLFVAGYYLSWWDAGQDANSPCVDAGSGLASDFGLDVYTTRTDGIGDDNEVDLGYHYEHGIAWYLLTINVVDANGDPIPDPNLVYGTVAPSEPRPISYIWFLNTYVFYADTQVTLVADPCDGYRVKAWSGAENEPAFDANQNTVIMTEHKTVTVEFEPIPEYELTVNVVDGNGFFSVDPNTDLIDNFVGYYLEGETVTFRAEPNLGYYVDGWYDANDGALLSVLTVYDVVIDSDQTIGLEFKLPEPISVGQGVGYDHTTIQAAVGAARSGDKIVVYPGTYDGDINLDGKEDVKLVSALPEDPCFVAAVIIDCGGSSRAFTFNHGEDANTLINGFTIINASSLEGPGGAIYIDADCSPTLANLIISDCSAATDGGAIYVGPGSSPSLRKVMISNCSVTNADGGAVYVSSNGQPDFIGCTITNCSAFGGYGGAVYCATGSWPLFIDCTFAENAAGYDGGGIYYAQDGNSTINGCTFTGNTAGYAGGGIAYDVRCISEVNGCTFTHNTATEDGGGAILYSSDNLILVIDSNFADNAANYGGALYFDPNCLGTIAHTVLVENDANGNGGAIFLDRDNYVDFNDCDISYNTAACGGGLYCFRSPESRIIRCEIKHNNASGGVTVWFEYFERDPNDPNFPLDPLNPIDTSDPNFDPNDPDYIRNRYEAHSDIAEGGGIYSWVGPRLIKDTEICYNTARMSGGGLYLASDEDPGTTIGPELNNCLIANNEAGRDGGGISCNWWLEAIISNCTIVNNEIIGGLGLGYGGGLYCSHKSYVEVINSIIWGNVSTYEGSQIAVGSGDWAAPFTSIVKISYSDIEPEPEPNEISELTALDIVFCIDTTGSMGGDIDAMKDAATGITGLIAASVPDFRIAVVDYKDFNESPYGGSDNYPYRDDSVFTTDTGAVVAAIDTLTASGGADGPESVLAVLMHCINHNALETVLDANLYGADPDHIGPGDWRAGGHVSRAIILMGDAPSHRPPHDPAEPFTGYTIDDVITAATESPTPIRIFTIPVRGWEETVEDFTALAEGTGGVMLEAAGSSEVVEAMMTAIGLITRIAPMIYVEDDCTLQWWDADSNSWDAGSHNIEDDPCFVNVVEGPNFVPGYYLSHVATGQAIDSNCIDAGDPNIVLDPNLYTTRTDGIGDANIVDIGYHYLIASMPRLTVIVVDANGDPVDPGLAHGYVDPNNRLYPRDAIVELVAHIDYGYRVKEWWGTDDDSSTEPNNTVTMTSDKTVTVEFEESPRHWLSTKVVAGIGTIEPPSGEYPEDVIPLMAYPGPGYRVRAWLGTADDLSVDPNNSVMLDSDKTVAVAFEEPQTIEVSILDEPNGIQDAVDAARSRDTIIVGAGRYTTGGIDLRGKDITITSTNPDDNDVVAATIIDCQQGGRAFIFNSGEGADTVVRSFTIVNANITGENGGAIYVGSNSSPTIKNLVISNCSAVADANGGGGYGGAIYVTDDSEPNFVNCVITNCLAEGGGGAYCDSNSSPTFWHCTFSENSAGFGGGMLCDSLRLITIADCNFSENTAPIGAGLYGEPNSVVAVTDSILIENVADNEGGAMYWIEATMSIMDSDITHNSAQYGGGLYCIYSPETTIIGCTVRYNQAPYDVLDPNDPNDPNALLVGQGGGIYCVATAALIRDCVITRNIANTSGGGLYLTGRSDTPLIPEIVNCLITSNLAGRDGAGISVNWNADPLIANCTIVSNAAPGLFGDSGTGLGGGFYCAYDSNSAIVDSILWNNYAPKGNEIAVGSGFLFDPIPSTLTVTYSDVKGGRSGAQVDDYCKLWGWYPEDAHYPSNIDTNPLFVTALLGDYYLSQTDAGQLQNSPCVDAGSDLAVNLDLVVNYKKIMYTTRTDEVVDIGTVDMGYHYTAATVERCRFCDLVYDGVIDFNDLEQFLLSWLRDDCSIGNGWCDGADFTFDGDVNFPDYALFAQCWFVADDEAPEPDPSQWKIEPYPSSETSIAMSAKPAFDAWGWDVKYYFECITDANFSSGWQSGTSNEATGLTQGAEYCFKVRARDGVGWIPDGTGEPGNKTDWSEIRCAVAGGGPDITEPQPPPVILTFEAISPNSITVTASISYDGSGVEYQFRRDSVVLSSWLDEPNWTDAGLVPDTQYCYEVRARDESPLQNTTGWSPVLCATTAPPEDWIKPEPNPAEWDPAADPCGEPHQIWGGGGDFDYWAEMTAMTATDASGVEYKFICDDSDFSSGGPSDQLYGEGVEWRNVDNVAGDPRVYRVKIGGAMVGVSFKVLVRDRSPNHNTTDPMPLWYSWKP